jgi:hypothetical protein
VFPVGDDHLAATGTQDTGRRSLGRRGLGHHQLQRRLVRASDLDLLPVIDGVGQLGEVLFRVSKCNLHDFRLDGRRWGVNQMDPTHGQKLPWMDHPRSGSISQKLNLFEHSMLKCRLANILQQKGHVVEGVHYDIVLSKNLLHF